MYESLALSLLSSLTSFLINTHFISEEQILIEKSPKWFEKYEEKNRIIAYSYKFGDIGYLEESKNICYKNLENKIDKSLTTFTKQVIKSNISPYYKDFVEQFKNLQNSDEFLNKQISYDKIYYKKESSEFFVKCSVSNKAFLAYEEVLTKNIGKNFSSYKFSKNQNELDEEINKR